MHHRLIAILAILCFAFGGAGCESLFEASKPKSLKKKKQRPEKKHYQEVVMPLQTGSMLQRRTYVEREPDSEPKKKTKQKESPTPTPKPKLEAEPSATPSPTEEESPAPTPERFR